MNYPTPLFLAVEEQQIVVPLAAENLARGELTADADAALQSIASQRAASPGDAPVSRQPTL